MKNYFFFPIFSSATAINFILLPKFSFIRFYCQSADILYWNSASIIFLFALFIFGLAVLDYQLFARLFFFLISVEFFVVIVFLFCWLLTSSLNHKWFYFLHIIFLIRYLSKTVKLFFRFLNKLKKICLYLYFLCLWLLHFFYIRDRACF